MTMRTSSIAIPLLFLSATVLSAQRWEVGGSAGYSLWNDVKVTNAAASGTTGFRPGIAFGAVLGNDINRRIGGEVRYTFIQDDLQVSSGSTKVTAAGQSHAMHYDFLVHATSRERSPRPFFAAGAGVKYYRGTGAESAFQPLSNLVVLTRTNEAQALISVGGGVKFPVSRRALVRLDFRDYITPYPSDLLALPPNSRGGGWLHNFVVMVGVSGLR
jgi:hypothetical protein